MTQTIRTGCFGITVTLGEPDEDGGRGGHIASDLHDGVVVCTPDAFDGAMDAIENLILAHACAGIDITTPEYLEGIETAVEGVANKFGD